MMKILIPSDFSATSHNATKFAQQYFSGVSANFYILHATTLKESKQHAVLQINTETKGKADTATMLLQEINFFKLNSKNSHHRFIPIEEDKNLVEAIRKQVAEKEIDYILMGTKGSTNRNEMGSNSWDVITKIKCPVFVIPENIKFNGIKNVGFITDYNSIYRNKVISRLSETMELQQSPLRVLHVRALDTYLNAAQTDNKGFLHYFFRDKKHSFHFVANKNLESGIQDFVETWEIGLLSVIAKNLNFIQRLLLRPAVQSVSYTTNVPFLVLHE